MTLRRTIITFLFGLFLKTAVGQTTTAEKLSKVIALSVQDDYSLTNAWTTCNKDSLFFKEDTIRFYNHVNYHQGFDCCYYLNWRFTDKTHFKQNQTSYCEEPPGETVYTDENSFHIDLVQQDNYTFINVYRKDNLLNRYKVVSVDKIVLDNKINSSYSLTLVRAQ